VTPHQAWKMRLTVKHADLQTNPSTVLTLLSITRTISYAKIITHFTSKKVMAQQIQHGYKTDRQSKEMRKKVEMFIQNFDDGLLVLDPYDMKIKMNNADNTQTRTLTDWTLQAIRDYEENKNDKSIGDGFAKTCLDWIRIGYANNMIKEGTNLLGKFDELRTEYDRLEEKHQTLEKSYIDLENDYRFLRLRKDKEARKQLC